MTLPYTSQPFIANPSTPPTVETVPTLPPSGTRLATSAQDMVSFEPSLRSYTVNYRVGYQPESPILGKHFITNRSVNTNIRVDFVIPSFLKVYPQPSFILHPDIRYEIAVMINEEDIREKSMTSIREYNGSIQCTVTPINVTQPIYIRI